ncbi:hypothetical protein [Salinibaculum rarum]|uniref:hypothetical protein n=1 Tax=Salinibaculum rarum TaxID=3058903 RepID=UPI00265F24B2|nr:hypothetical protein [Salinibaculum sp. KK48]
MKSNVTPFGAPDLYDDLEQEVASMLVAGLDTVSDDVIVSKVLHETNPDDRDGRERVIFVFTAHRGESISSERDAIEALSDEFSHDTRFTTWMRGGTYALGVFA